MAYVAVTGGKDAIEQSLRLLKAFSQSGQELSVRAIAERLPLLVDKIMSEAGLYSPQYAALALKQSEGSPEEAVFLLRAYRSTLQRNYYSTVTDTGSMRLIRRISAAFKDIPGGQILGPTFDYSHRLLDFSLTEDGEARESAKAAGAACEWAADGEGPEAEDIYCGRVSDLLRKEGLLPEPEEDDEEPFDVTSSLLTFPAPRSARLQTFQRADSGFLGGVAYSSMRGYGSVHPTVSELRCGYLSVSVRHPLIEGEEICVGEILVTEVEALVPSHTETDGEFDQMTLAGGYGLILGRNENKAIAMAIADASLETEGSTPSQDEEFVLTHGDSLEMSGFISHLKLPHYVTFRSKLDRVRDREGEENHD